MIKLSVITDEVSQSIPDVLGFARRFSLDAVELRSVEGLGPFLFTDALVTRMREAFAGEGLDVCCLSLPLFKCSIDDAAERAAHVEALRRVIGHAHTLGCRLLRGFCFWQSPERPLPLGEIADAYQAIAPLLRDAGMTVVLESDPSVYGHTAAELAAILRAIDSPFVRALWDGGNLLFAENGETPLKGYTLLAPWIAHVHVKDAARTADGVQAVCVGRGEAQVAEQIALLLREGYDGYLSLETHYRLAGEIDESLMRLPGGDAFSQGALEASTESMEALKQIIQEAKAHAKN